MNAGVAENMYVQIENREVAMDAANNQSFRLRRWGAETIMRTMRLREEAWPDRSRAGALWLQAQKIANDIGEAVDVELMQNAPPHAGPEPMYYAWLLRGQKLYTRMVIERAVMIMEGM